MQTRNLLLKTFNSSSSMNKYLKHFLFYFIIYILCNDKRSHFLSFFFKKIQTKVYPLVSHKIILSNGHYTGFSLRFVKHLPKVNSQAFTVLKQFCLERLCEFHALKHFIFLCFSVCISNLNQKQSTPVKIPGVLWSVCLYPEQSWQA